MKKRFEELMNNAKSVLRSFFIFSFGKIDPKIDPKIDYIKMHFNGWSLNKWYAE